MCAVVRFAPFLDHTLLAPEATAADIDRLCDDAAHHAVAAVCVHPRWVRRCVERLRGTAIPTAAVVGFPSGAHVSRVKALEAAVAIEDGARELDVVAPLGAVCAGAWGEVEDDLAAVMQVSATVLVKVIVESAALTPDQIVHVCRVVRASGAGYVKTSTGFHPRGGATAAAVRLMRETVGDALGVKASGGIRDCAAAAAMFAAGATRIGTSRGAELAECVGEGPRPLAHLDPARDRVATAAATGTSAAAP